VRSWRKKDEKATGEKHWSRGRRGRKKETFDLDIFFKRVAALAEIKKRKEKVL
jgi:hypothetical protein